MTDPTRRTRTDQLGVVLATATNRRTVLKFLLVGSAALLGVPAAVDALADAAASNNQTGTCSELSAYRVGTGVTDAAGTPHAGYAGWTDGKVSANYNASWTPTQGWVCPCPNITDEVYPDQTSCDHVCHPGLGGCLIACGGGVCVETKPLKIKLGVQNTINRLSWAPPGGEKAASEACRKELRRWNSGIDAHEAHHAADNTGVVTRANAAAATKRYKACGKTQAEAEAKVKAQLNKAATDAYNAAVNEMDQLRDAFHGTTAGSAINEPDCGVCG